MKNLIKTKTLRSPHEKSSQLPQQKKKKKITEAWCWLQADKWKQRHGVGGYEDSGFGKALNKV